MFSKIHKHGNHARFVNGPIVYRLGRQVFILESGVRFPVGLQKTLMFRLGIEEDTSYSRQVKRALHLFSY